MRKEVWIFVVVLAIVFLGFGMTGFVVNDGEGYVVRDVVVKNDVDNTTDVVVAINAPYSTLSIEENFTGEGCEVLSYSLDKEIDIFGFNEHVNAWIFGNRSDTIEVELSYSIPYDCDVGEGMVYVVSEGEIESYWFSDFFGDGGNDDSSSSSSPSSNSPSSGGGSSGGGGGAVALSAPIVQAETHEEFEELVSEALDNLAGVEVGEELDRGSFGTILVLIVVAVLIVGFIVFMFLRRPKSFEGEVEQTNLKTSSS